MSHVAIAQINSTDDLEKNKEQILELIETAAQLAPKPKVIFFPENSLYFRINSKDSVQAIGLRHPAIKKIESIAVERKMIVHLTTAVEQNGKIFNSSILINADGKSEILYNKIHLFDVSIQGQAPILESQVFSRGDSTKIFTIDGVQFGSSICYDVRFSELYSVYAKAGVHSIVVPSAFLVKTGQAHWMTLLRARAIESQCYVIAAAQCGRHESTKFPGEFRETFGHSVIFDPWGETVALKESGVGIITATLDLGRCENVRKSIPMASHRRL